MADSDRFPVADPPRAQAARDQFHLFQSILDSMGDGLVVADERGHFLLFNPAAERILGRGLSDVPRERWAETYGVFYSDTHQPYPSNQMPLAQAIRGVETDQVELFIRNPSRPEGVYISVSGRPIRDPQGKLSGGVVVFRDVTLRRETEEQLVAKRRLLNALMDHIPDNIYFKDLDNRFIRVNRTVSTRFGLTHPQEAVGKTDRDFFLEEHARQAGLDEQEIMRTRKPIINKEEKETWPDGRVTWASTNKMPLFDEAGQVIGTFGISRDITEHKKQEEQLLKLSQALEQTADAVYIMDRNGTIEYINPAFTRMTGYERADALGHNPRLLRSPDQDSAVEDELRALLEEGQTWRKEREYRRQDGRIFIADETITPLRDATEEITHFVATCKDVTEAHRGLEELRRSRERFAAAVEGSRDGIWDWDLETNQVYFSPRWKSMLGYEDSELPSQFEEWTDRLHPDDRGRVMSVLHSYLHSRLPDYEVEFRLRHRDGSYRWILTRGVAFRDARGKPQRMAGSHTDITERKKNEEALRKAMVEAEAANRAKNQFLATVSHEIRTPMNGILNMTDLALATDLTREQREYLELVKSSADSLLVVIQDILDFSKIEAGRLDIDSHVFSLHDGLADAVKSLALKAHAKHIELALRIADDVPDWVVGDDARLRQILVNLVGNAIKFTDQGEVVVVVERGPSVVREGGPEASARTSDHESRSPIHFTVRDTGIGIPTDKQQAIFVPFVQADGSMSRRHGGTGLGLSIAARLVELMGGHIHLESEPGRGSTFSFTLPLPPADPALPRPPRLGRAALKGLRVLVVDDNSTNRVIVAEMTRAWGMEAVQAVDGPTALAELKRAAVEGQGFPLVLLDAMMPGMDGFSLAEEIRQHPQLAGATIMMLTSADRLGDSARCREAGIASYLTKPLKASELYDAIIQVLGANVLEEDALAPALAEPTTQARERAGSMEPPAVTRPLNILVAEDQPINQALVLNLLHRQGHRVVVVANGVEAVAAFERQRFDIVFMDVSMPEMDGFEATGRLRELERESGHRTPIIAMTAHAMKGDRERCLEAGMDGYMPKPIRAAELWQALADLACQGADAVTRPGEGSAVSLIDREAALNCVGGDLSILHAMIEMYQTEGPIMRQAVVEAVRRRDPALVRRSAHTLKGTLGHLGAVGVVPLAQALEQKGHGGDLTGVEEALTILEKSLDRLDVELCSLGREIRVG